MGTPLLGDRVTWNLTTPLWFTMETDNALFTSMTQFPWRHYFLRAIKRQCTFRVREPCMLGRNKGILNKTNIWFLVTCMPVIFLYVTAERSCWWISWNTPIVLGRALEFKKQSMLNPKYFGQKSIYWWHHKRVFTLEYSFAPSTYWMLIGHSHCWRINITSSLYNVCLREFLPPTTVVVGR